MFNSALNTLHTLSHFRVCVFVSIYKPNKSLTDCLMRPGKIRTVLHLWPTAVMIQSSPRPSLSPIPPPRKCKCYFQPAVTGQPSLSPKSLPTATSNITDVFLDDPEAWGNPQVSSESFKEIYVCLV